MAQFLDTSGVTYHLERIIKKAEERLTIISPYLKFNDRIKQLFEDQDRKKIDIRIVYGKSDLAPSETQWLETLESVRTSFHKNLHAKCYMNEENGIITSMNLYEFSQQHNSEMGVFFTKTKDPELYGEAYNEAKRLIRHSETVRLRAETAAEASEQITPDKHEEHKKQSSSKIAKSLGMKTPDFLAAAVTKGWLIQSEGGYLLTDTGKLAGVELKDSKRFGEYFVWPTSITDSFA